MRRSPAGLGFLGLLVLGGCGGTESSATQNAQAPTPGMAASPLEGFISVDRLPTPTDPHLIMGREVWAGTCQACHGLGEAGSPKITNKEAWAPRIAKGMAMLHQHALKGFIGPSGTMMPERGGNPQLTDEQIIAAVDFMVANSR